MTYALLRRVEHRMGVPGSEEVVKLYVLGNFIVMVLTAE